MANHKKIDLLNAVENAIQTEGVEIKGLDKNM